MSNSHSSDSESSDEESDTKPSRTKVKESDDVSNESVVKKTLPRGKRFRLDDESSSSDEESSGMGLPRSKKRAASPYKTSEDEGKWSCRHCTYENDPSVMICAMCDQ